MLAHPNVHNEHCVVSFLAYHVRTTIGVVHLVVKFGDSTTNTD